jgi:predicted CoA-binding protein
MPFLTDENAVRELLLRVRRIAVVGLSPKAHRDSHRVAHYMQEHGYEIVPVHPRGGVTLGARVHGRVQDIEGDVDLVDVFRRPEAISDVVDDVLAKAGQQTSPPALWFQLGCVDEPAARRAADAGLAVVLDQCLMVEHAALLGRGHNVSSR